LRQLQWYETESTVLHLEVVLLPAASVAASGSPALASRFYQELPDLINNAAGEDRNVTVLIATSDAASEILDPRRATQRI
jgi:hypothetical protein